MKYLLTLLFIIISTLVMAQDANSVEMADAFRAHGKIYIVLSVVLILIVGLFAYLIRLETKISELEKDKNSAG